MLDKDRKRLRRKIHIRKRIAGTAEKPRMSVFRSNKAISVEVIDDIKGVTLASASTLEKQFKTLKGNIAGAATIGEEIGKRLLEKGIKTVVFDRNGYLYHGQVKALADGARKTGIIF
jgi:large subunit ribosomal protein L18